MRVSRILPGDLVLALDRRAQCYRMVPAVETDVVDEYGGVVSNYAEVDTERGELTRVLPSGKRVVIFGTYRVVLKDWVAKVKSRDGIR